MIFSKMSVLCAHVVCLSSFAAFTGSIRAQESNVPPVSTERPSQGASPDLVPVGSLQLENGMNVNFQRGQYVADLPENFIRYGVSKHVEVRFLSSNMVYRSSSAPEDSLFESQDLGFSAKVGIESKRALVPKALILSLGVPTGGNNMTTASYDPGLAVIWAQSFHGYSLMEQAHGTLTTLVGARRTLWTPCVSVGHSITRSAGLFVEYAPAINLDNSLTQIVDGGLTFARGPLRQFDMRAGYQKDTNGLHTLVSLGYTVRRDHFFRSFRGY